MRDVVTHVIPRVLQSDGLEVSRFGEVLSRAIMHDPELNIMGRCLESRTRLERLLTSLPVARIIDMYLNDSQMMDLAIDRAYGHPAGFVRVLLYTDPRDIVQLRLHIWDGLRMDKSAHDHPWESVSLVCSGELHDERLSLEHGNDFDISIFEATQRGLGRSVSVGHANLRQATLEHVKVGGVYFIPTGVIHRTHVPTQTAVTLFLRGPYLRNWSLVLRQPADNDYDALIGFRMEKAQIESALLSAHQCLTRVRK